MKSDQEIMRSIRAAIDDCTRGNDNAPSLQYQIARKAKREEPVRRKISLALVLGIVGILALMGTAYALFSSQVAEFFGQHWNQELGVRLHEGKIAQIGESVTVGDVVFTLDEIVYRDRALYGVGTARAVHENDVLISLDLANDPEWFAVSEEAQAYVEKAKASGGRLLAIDSWPRAVGVDEGTMLSAGSVGYYDISNPDGSLTFSFEAADGFAISEGTSYQIQMQSSIWQVAETGETVEDSMQEKEWIVSCVPVILAEVTSSAPKQPASIENAEGYELLVPAAYQETGTLPIYGAVETDFASVVNPEWFNTSGISSGEGTEEICFADHAILNPGREALFYYEFTDDHYTEAASNIIVDRAWVRNWSGHRGEFTLDRTELTGITLAEAQATAEEMIARLGIDGNQYVCTEALDMSLERIRTMGAIYEQAILDGKLLTDDDHQPYDYNSIPASEEGYYLVYSPLGVDSANSRHSVIFYITSRGIVYAAVRNQFTWGEMVSTPEALITPDAAISRLAEEYGRSIYDSNQVIQSIQQVALTYEAVRADNRAEGMIFVPVWKILYQDESAVQNDFTCYALINAVDGSLIDASFQ